MDEILGTLRDWWRGFLAHLPHLVLTLIVLVLTWLVARFLSFGIVRVVARTRLRRSLQELFAKLVATAIWVVGLFLAATILFPGITPGKLITVLGIGSIAVGFAFKDIFENFMAGIVVLLRNVIEIGDVIEWSDYVGRVEDITIRDTHLRELDGRLVIIPNAKLFQDPVEILTDRKQRRVSLACGVAYGEDVDESRAVIERAVRSCDSVIAEGRPVEVFARAFGSSSIDFEIRWWTGSSPVEQKRSTDQVVAAVKRALDEAGIEIPFPYRTLTFKEPLGVRRDGAGEEE